MTPSPPSARKQYDLCGAAHDYPAWDGPPRRTLLICSQPRSGSTMLGEALYFAGGLGCPLEYIHAGFRAGFEDRWGVAGLVGVARAARRLRTDPGGTLAVKLFWHDVLDLIDEAMPGVYPALRGTPADAVPPATYRAIGALLRDLFPDPVHVHLERRDRLRQAVSVLSATQTGVWRSIPESDGAASVPAGPVAYDFDRIGRMMSATAACHAHWRAFFDANGIHPQALTYEDLVADYDGTVGHLLHALGHPGPVPPVRMERQSTAASEALMRRFLADQRALMRR